MQSAVELSLAPIPVSMPQSSGVCSFIIPPQPHSIFIFHRHEAISPSEAFASTSSSPSLSSSDPRSNSHSPKASGMVSPDVEHSARYPHYVQDPRHVGGASHRYTDSFVLRVLPPHLCPHSHSSSFDSLRSNSGMPYNNYVGQPPLHYSSNSRPAYQSEQLRHVQLFDPENPHRPHPTYMTHFIHVFFERYGQDFAFLSYQDVLADYWDQRISLPLANCIAAMAMQSVPLFLSL